MALGHYLNISYWNQRGDESHPPWTDVLWDLRSKAGQRFADRLAAETLVGVAEDTNLEGWSSMRHYVLEHLRSADALIDSDQKEWPKILDVLRRHDAMPHEYPDAR
jgi:hypothetical protein